MNETHVAARLRLYLVLTTTIAFLFVMAIWWRPALCGAGTVALLLTAIAATELRRPH